MRSSLYRHIVAISTTEFFYCSFTKTFSWLSTKMAYHTGLPFIFGPLFSFACKRLLKMFHREFCSSRKITPWSSFRKAAERKPFPCTVMKRLGYKFLLLCFFISVTKCFYSFYTFHFHSESFLKCKVYNLDFMTEIELNCFLNFWRSVSISHQFSFVFLSKGFVFGFRSM